MVPAGHALRRRRRDRRRVEPVLPVVRDDGLPAGGQRAAVDDGAGRPARAPRPAAGDSRRHALSDGDLAGQQQAAAALVLDRGRGSGGRPPHRKALLLLEAAGRPFAGDVLSSRDSAPRAPSAVGVPAGDQVPVRVDAAHARGARPAGAGGLPGAGRAAAGRAARAARPARVGPRKRAQPRRRAGRAAAVPAGRRPARHPLAHQRPPRHGVRARARGRCRPRGGGRAGQPRRRGGAGIRAGGLAGGGPVRRADPARDCGRPDHARRGDPAGVGPIQLARVLRLLAFVAPERGPLPRGRRRPAVRVHADGRIELPGLSARPARGVA